MYRWNVPSVAVLFAFASVSGIGTVTRSAPPDSAGKKQVSKIVKASPEAKQAPALNGYCPVSYQLEMTPVGGDPALHVMYRNKLYYLANEDAKKKFINNPERFAPRLDGLCATALGGPYGNRFDGDPTVYAVFDERLYLFSSERAKRSYEGRPKAIVVNAENLFGIPRLNGMCVVSYLERKAAIQGELNISYPYRHWTYFFAGGAERSDFMKDPQKYLPQYDMFCAEAMSRGKHYPGDPNLFVVWDQKTYLFQNEKAQIQFQADPRKVIDKANAEWEIFKKRPKLDPGH